jgi:putative DNA primase/helicase
LLTNDLPKVPAQDAALWERIHLIPFDIRFVDHPTADNERQADHNLPDKLRAEASGILSWLVRGCLQWQKNGITRPDTVQCATNAYRKDEDHLENFLSDRCVRGDSFKVQAKLFYRAYCLWCEEMGLKSISGISFGKNMQALFDSARLNNRHVFYLGIGLLDEE